MWDSDLLNNTIITDNILYYISSNNVQKLVKIVICSACINNIIQEVFGKKNKLGTYTILVDLKNNRKLIYASSNVYKIVWSTEKEFFLLIRDHKQILKKEVYTMNCYLSNKKI